MTVNLFHPPSHVLQMICKFETEVSRKDDTEITAAEKTTTEKKILSLHESNSFELICHFSIKLFHFTNT